MKQSIESSLICIYFFIVPLLMLNVLPASAAIDNLEDIGADGTPVTSRVIEGVTVSISTSANSNLLAGTYFGPDSPTAFTGANYIINAPLNPENVSGTRFISDISIELIQPIIFEFSEPVLEFGLTTLDLLESASSANAFVTLEAQDSGGSVVASHTRTGPQGPSGLDLDWLVTSASPNIDRVLLLSNITPADGANYGIDDLQVVVPIPAAFWLLGSGLLGFVIVARRKKIIQ